MRALNNDQTFNQQWPKASEIQGYLQLQFIQTCINTGFVSLRDGWSHPSS